MKIHTLILSIAAAAVLSASAAAQPTPSASSPPAPSRSTGLKVEKIADGVWAAAPAKGANVGWFVLGDGVVAVDSGADAATGQEILKSIADTTGGKPVRLLVLTHAHADHSGG